MVATSIAVLPPPIAATVLPSRFNSPDFPAAERKSIAFHRPSISPFPPPMLMELGRPIPIKTASNPSSMILSRLKPGLNSLPSRKIIRSFGTSVKIAEISLLRELLCLSAGMTDTTMPPNSVPASKIVTVCPASRSFAAQESPAGPAPITAMFFPVLSFGIRSFDQPFLLACSARYLCISAIGRGPSPINFCRQWPSHCCSTGHSQAQTSGKIFASLSVS